MTTKFISIGYNCFPKKYINHILHININKSIEDIYNTDDDIYYTQLFDFIGTPMYTINKIISEGLEGLNNIENYTIRQICKNKPYKCVLQTQYNIRVPHYLNENFTKIDLDKFINSMNRKMLRLNTILSDNNNIIYFIRLSENIQNMIIYNDSHVIYDKTEYEYLNDFINIISSKYPLLRFNILFYNYNENKYENNIISIKVNYDELNWDNCVDIFSKSLSITMNELINK